MNSGLSKRTKWCYSLGGFRDVAYQLVATFLILNVQYTIDITTAQFAVIGIIMIACKIWDAINDPMMGTIIENSSFKMGKFRPWILFGCLINSVIIVLLFNVRFSGWGYVVFFGVFYLLWGMTFTMNDVSFWAMLPALSSDAKERSDVTTLMNIFASVGSIGVNGVLMLIAAGNTVVVYSVASIVVSAIFIGAQLITVIGVHEEPAVKNEDKKSITLKDMFRMIVKNDQLMWITIVVLLYYVGSGMLVAFAQNYCYFEFSYSEGGTWSTIFVAMYAVGTIASQVAYGAIAKKFTRAQILRFSIILVAIGYGLFMLFGVVLPKEIWVIAIIGICAFGGQGLFYLTLLIQMTNTIEYNDYKYGERNESIIFSLRSFVAKLSSALQQGVFTLILILGGVYGLTQKIKDIENNTSLTDVERLAQGDAIIQSATSGMKFALKVGVALVPLILIVLSYFIVRSKYKIDEKMYDEMTKAISERDAKIKE